MTMKEQSQVIEVEFDEVCSKYVAYDPKPNSVSALPFSLRHKQW